MVQVRLSEVSFTTYQNGGVPVSHMGWLNLGPLKIFLWKLKTAKRIGSFKFGVGCHCTMIVYVNRTSNRFYFKDKGGYSHLFLTFISLGIGHSAGMITVAKFGAMHR